jgi:hypothetical protein
MKLSEVSITQMLKGIRVETTTDALRNLREIAAWSRQQERNYIAEFGDVEVEYDEEYKVYRVPAFAERIAKYIEAKQIDCKRWGCE